MKEPTTFKLGLLVKLRAFAVGQTRSDGYEVHADPQGYERLAGARVDSVIDSEAMVLVLGK
jgi:hypothetical protein